jgi:hypothetical protein
MTCKENASPPAGRNYGKPSEKTRGALLAAIREKNNQTTHSLLVSVFFSAKSILSPPAVWHDLRGKYQPTRWQELWKTQRENTRSTACSDPQEKQPNNPLARTTREETQGPV